MNQAQLALTPRGGVRLNIPARAELVSDLAKEILKEGSRPLPPWLCSEIIDLSASGLEISPSILDRATQGF